MGFDLKGYMIFYSNLYTSDLWGYIGNIQKWRLGKY